MDKIEMTSPNGKVHAEVSVEANEELKKIGIDLEKEVGAALKSEEDMCYYRKEKKNYVGRKEFNALNFMITLVILSIALFAWRVSLRHKENITNIAKICDRIGIEYSVSTNHIGLANEITIQ